MVCAVGLIIRNRWEYVMSKKAKDTATEKCLKNCCKIAINTDINSILVAPFDGVTPDIHRLFSYFLHNAPDIQSVHSKTIPLEFHSGLFSRMLQNRHFYYQKFCWLNAPIQKELEKGFLAGDALCLKCKRFVCKKEQRRKNQLPESDLDCFLRHIRNAIAHGRVYYLHGGNRVHIIFEDINDAGNITARIVCIKADLEYWKKTLENPKNYGAE